MSESGSTIPHQVPTLPVRRLRVEVVTGPDAGVRHVAEGDTVSVGTAPNNDLRLTDPTVSGFHLELTCADDHITVRDLGSTNGTRLGAVRLESAVIPPATRLSLGASQIVVDEAGTTECEMIEGHTFGHIRGRSPAMRRLLARAGRVAGSDASVLLLGETGTGKEVLAESIHQASPRREQPFETVDCGSLLPTLVASELFGHERGAFTGAEQQHIGAFERANHGTVFLDEIGELPPALQTNLLGVLERRRFKRLGGKDWIPLDVRVVCATNRDLRAEVNKGTFREDLYFRIAVVLLHLPPLRERADDIPLLVEHFLAEEGVVDREGIISDSVMKMLRQHRWAGNVRELRNFVEAAVALGEAPPLDAGAMGGEGTLVAELKVRGLESKPSYKTARDLVLREFERIFLTDLLARTEGNVSRAAREAEMDRNYLTQLLERRGLRKPKSRSSDD